MLHQLIKNPDQLMKILRGVFKKTTARFNFNHLIKLILFLLFFLIPLFTASQTQAQTVSISVWPPIIELNLQPGQSLNQPIQIKNLGDSTTMLFNIFPFTPADEQGHILLQPITNFPALKFIQISEPSIKLASGQSHTLSLNLTIPENSPLADHYLSLTLTAQTKGLIKNTGSLTQPVIALPILLTISSPTPAQPSVKIVEFTAPLISDSFSPIIFNLRLKNTGSVRLKTIGHINIYNLFNQKIATIPLRQDNILVNSIRQLTSQDQPGKLQFKALLPFGRYQAQAFITPENSNHTISETFIFYYFPFKLFLIFLLPFLYLPLKKKLIKIYQSITKKLLRKK